MSSRKEVIFHIPTLRGGGAERVATEIAKHFLAAGLSPVFFIHMSGAAYKLPENIEVIVAKRRTHLGRVLDFAAELKVRQPAAVISFLPYANVISVLAKLMSRSRTRLAVSEHLAFTSLRNVELKARIMRWLSCWLYQLSDSIIAVSSGVANDLRSMLKSSGRNKIVVIHNPCFVPGAEPRSPLPLRSGAAILAVGRLMDQKGFDVLIRAFALVKQSIGDATLVLAGEGPNRAALEALIDELGLTNAVTCPGFVADTSALYREADLLVCSSRFEGFGNVIVEALSFGLRVVSTRCPHGPEEILDNGRFGRLVPVDDEARLAAAILESLSSSVDQTALIARAKQFSLQAVGDKYLEQAGLASYRLSDNIQVKRTM